MQQKISNNMPKQGAIYAMFSAILFGLSTPFAKLLLEQINPVLLAGLFYLGLGLGMLVLKMITKQFFKLPKNESVFFKNNWYWLLGAILAGGILAPLALMLGLSTTYSATASLCLNLECVFTACIAWFIFKENYNWRVVIGMLFIFFGGVILSVDLNNRLIISTGVLFIMIACLGWAADNNLTRKIAITDPLVIACYKGFIAGFVNTALALSLGINLPSLNLILASLLVGFIGYGISLILFVYALRHIGAARSGVYFALAPFIGAVASIVILHEVFTLQLIVAAFFMVLGLWLHLTEKHGHLHVHHEMEHSHEHIHDEHHQHEHSADDLPGEPHTHQHKHKHLMHDHPHFPDIHHEHEH